MKIAAVILAIVVLATAASSAQQASLRTVMERAAAYVSDFENQLGGIVVEESYFQEVIPPGPLNSSLSITGGAQGRGGTARVPTLQPSSARAYRELRSDLLLVHPVNGSRWVQFRDVFEIDRSPVHDRNDRLAQLFLKPSTNTAEQAQRIQTESARYNIGDLERTINVPVLPLLFLEEGLQPHFEFTRVLDWNTSDTPAVPKDVPDDRAFVVPPGTIEIQYREKEDARALIHTTADRPLLAHGRFWLDPTSGSVFLSEMILEDPLFVYGAIHVAYKLNSELGYMVPDEMREHYLVRASGYEINGTATYSKFRQFQVAVDEELQPTK